MPELEIPLGSKINQTKKNTIQIKVPNTGFWILGKQKPDLLWDAYIIEPKTKKKELIKENTSTRLFSLFSNLILKTPFPYTGKRGKDPKEIKRFIKKLAKQTNKHEPNPISSSKCS